MSGCDEKKSRSLWLSDMQEVIKVMEAVENNIPRHAVSSAILIVQRDDGEDLAEVWWDSESESWLCDWKRGSGA